MGAARIGMSRTDGLRFWKLCGSGKGEGFTPVPNTEVWAILAVWDDPDRAREAVGHGVWQRWGARADETWTVFCETLSSRGAWSGNMPFVASVDDGSGPLAVLTRATIRLSSVPRFWQQEPAVSARIGEDSDVLFKIGIGEIPWLHQVTFSIWPDAAAIRRFAHEGAHKEAVRSVREGGWFTEELYARFRVTGSTGRWGGFDPLAKAERTAA